MSEAGTLLGGLHETPPRVRHRRKHVGPAPPLDRADATDADLLRLLDASLPALAACRAQLWPLVEGQPPDLAERLLAWEIHANQMTRMAAGWRTDGFPEPRYAFLLLAELLEHARRGYTLLALEAEGHYVRAS